jgi:hypothetical protein
MPKGFVAGVATPSGHLHIQRLHSDVSVGSVQHGEAHLPGDMSLDGYVADEDGNSTGRRMYETMATGRRPTPLPTRRRWSWTTPRCGGRPTKVVYPRTLETVFRERTRIERTSTPTLFER